MLVCAFFSSRVCLMLCHASKALALAFPSSAVAQCHIHPLPHIYSPCTGHHFAFLVLLRCHGFGSGFFSSMLAFNLPPSEYPSVVCPLWILLFLSSSALSSTVSATNSFFAVLPSNFQPLFLHSAWSSMSSINVCPSGLVSICSSFAPVALAISSASSMSLV